MMTVMTRVPRDSKGWTVADLEHLPDDGQRYELLDGELLVSSAPAVRHQVVALELAIVLRAACPAGLYVLRAPVDWQPDGPTSAGRTSFQPDVLLVPAKSLDAKNITEPLPLAVEVLSPSTRGRDLVEKRAKYESSGVASYWVVDPDEPSVLARDLVDGRYRSAGAASGAQKLELTLPFPVTLTPSALLAPYHR